MALCAPQTIHATAILIGECGILIRGETGAGKSTLAREVLAAADAKRVFGRLVADDCTRVEEWHGRLVARSVAPIEGLIEVRGSGIIRVDHEAAAVLRLVVDLSHLETARLPAVSVASVSLCGVTLPRLRAQKGDKVADLLLRRACGLWDAVVTE